MSRRNKRERKKVEHAFGPAYGNWLDYFELLEDILEGRTKSKNAINADGSLHKKLSPPWDGTCLFFDPVKVRNIDSNGNMIPTSQWSKESKDYQKMHDRCLGLWGQHAQTLRNAFKFKVTESHFYKAIKRTSDPIEVTAYLPFGYVFIQITPDETWSHDPRWSADGYKELLLCERQKCREDYPELNLKKGETFICITPAVYIGKSAIKSLIESKTKAIKELDFSKSTELLSHDAAVQPRDGVRLYPVELHLEENQHVVFEKSEHYEESPHLRFTDVSRGGLTAYATGADETKWQKKKLSEYWLIHFFNFLWLLNFKESKQTNYGRIKAENVIRRKPKHRKQHPVYEYSVLELDLKEDEPSTNIIMPRESAKKRQHMVIGHWRTYKKPLKSGPNKGKTEVLIKEHWRGDKNLGVIRKDYIFNNGEKDGGGEPDDESTIH